MGLLEKEKKVFVIILVIVMVILISFVLKVQVKTPTGHVSAEIAGINSYLLTAYYPFDTNALDYSGNNNNGAAYGNPVYVFGKIGNALSFSGRTDYVSIPDSSSLDITNDITIVGWFRHDSNTIKNWETMIAKGDSSYRLHLNSNNKYGISKAFVFNVDTPSGTKYANSGVIPVIGQWYHIAARFDGTTIKIYVNGELKQTNIFPATIIRTNNYALGIGTNTQVLNQQSRYWNGVIDEVKIYNRALTEQEILNDYLGLLTQTLNLQPGWNLISTYLNLQDSSVQNNLPGILGIYEYDTTQKKYIETTSLQPKKGYWIAVDTAKTFDLVGTEILDNSLNLQTGWNLIGVVQPKTLNIGGNILGIYEYSSGSYIPTISLEPGKGYWIAVDADITV